MSAAPTVRRPGAAADSAPAADDPLLNAPAWRVTVRYPQVGVEAVLAIPNTDKARKAGLDVWAGATITVRQADSGGAIR